MRKSNYKNRFNRPYPIFAEGGGGGGMGGMMNTRGMMDQQKVEKKVNHTTGTFLMDAGKWMLNQAVTPLETIAGREIYEPEFNYSGWDKADAVTSGIASAATDIVGTYFGGPFYTMGKKAVSSTANKIDPDNKLSYRPGEGQVTKHGGDVSYKIGNREYKTRGSVSNRTAGNVRTFEGGGGAGWQNFANVLGGNTGNTSTDGFMSMLTGGSSTDAAANGNSTGEFMSSLTGSLGGSEKMQGIMGTYGKASGKINPNTIDGDTMNKGLNREWSGLDGGLISTWTDKTPNQINALNALQDTKDMHNNFANQSSESNMRMYTNDGGPGGSTIGSYGNDANNAFTNWANSRTAVGNDNWNRVGNTIAKVGNLASNYVGGGGAPGGDGSAMFSGGGGSNSFFSGMGGSSAGGFDMSSMMGGGGGSGGGGFDMNSIMGMMNGGGGGQGGGGFDINQIMKMFGGAAAGGAAPSEHGGNIKNNDMRTYAYGDKVKAPTKEGLGYTTESTLPPGVTWDGQQYNVNQNANTTFEIEEGNTHENGGTYMDVPAEGEGNTIIEAEKGEVADVGNGETYIWSKNKYPGTNLTFAKRKQNRDAKASKIETELKEITSSSNTDEYRKNTLMRQLMLLEVEENSDKDLQGNIKRKKELKERIDLDNLLIGNTAIAKNGSYVKKGKRKKLTAFQESIYNNAIMRMGTEVKYDNGDKVKKPKKPTRPFGNVTSMDYQKKMRDYKKAMTQYQSDMKSWQESQNTSNETNTDESTSTGVENTNPVNKESVDLSDARSTNNAESIFGIEENDGEWEYKVNGQSVSADEYDQAITDFEADPAGFATVPFAPGNLSLEKNQTGPVVEQSNTDGQELQSQDDLVPQYNAEGILTGFKNPEPIIPPQEKPITLPPADIEPINNQPTEGAQSLEGAAIPPDLQVKMDERAAQIANDREQAAKNYDVPEESLVYNDEGQLVPEVGTKSNKYGDTWGENGWNDDAPEKRQNEILSNLERELTPDNSNTSGGDPLENDSDLESNVETNVTEVPEKNLDNVVVGEDNAEEGDASDNEAPAMSDASKDFFNKGKGFKYNKKGKPGNTEEGTAGTEGTEGNAGTEGTTGTDGTDGNAGTDGTEGTDGTGTTTDNTGHTGYENATVSGVGTNKTSTGCPPGECPDGTGGCVPCADNTTVEEVNNNVVKGAVPGGTGGWNHQSVTIPSFSSMYAQGIGKSPYDWLGDAGLIYGAQAGIGNTKKFWDEYQSLPNENFWDGVGKRREDRLNNNLGVIDAARKNTKRDLRQDLNTILRGNRNTASSFGNLNARDQNAFNTYAENSIDSDIKYGLMGLDKQSQLGDAEWETDKLERKGDWAVRERDQEDLSGYYTQLGADKQNIAKNMMELAKNKNTGWASMLQGNALNSMGGFQFGPDGKIIPNNTTNNITNNYHQNPDTGEWTLCPGGNCDHIEGEVDPNDNTKIVENNVEVPGDNVEVPGDNVEVPGENTETIVNQPSGYFKTTNQVGGLKEFSGDYSPINEDGSLNTGYYQEWLNIHKDPTGKKLSRLTQSGDQGNTTTYSDNSGVNVQPADWDEATQGPWTMPFPGRDNTVGKNVKTTADWYGEDYLRHLIETGQYNPAAVEGEQGYTTGLLTGEGSGTYQIPLNPDSKTMESTTTFEGGEDLDPTTWNQTQKDAWLAANEGKTIADAINLYNPTDSVPSTQRHGGRIAKMMYGTGVKRYDKGDHVHPHEDSTPISDEVKQNYHDLYGETLSKKQINRTLKELNPMVGDTVFMQPTNIQIPTEENTEGSNIANMSNTDKQTNMMKEFMLQNYTDGDGEYSMSFMDPFRRLFAPNPDGSYPTFPEGTVSGVRSTMSSKTPLMENYSTQTGANVNKAIELATPKEVKRDGGLVEYFKSERDKNRKNNRNLADQRISEFQHFMKNRK